MSKQEYFSPGQVTVNAITVTPSTNCYCSPVLKINTKKLKPLPLAFDQIKINMPYI